MFHKLMLQVFEEVSLGKREAILFCICLWISVQDTFSAFIKLTYLLGWLFNFYFFKAEYKILFSHKTYPVMQLI